MVIARDDKGLDILPIDSQNPFGVIQVVVVGGPVLMLLQAFGLLEDKRLTDLMLVPVVIGGYVVILGTAGAFFGLVLSGRKNPAQPDPSR